MTNSTHLPIKHLSAFFDAIPFALMYSINQLQSTDWIELTHKSQLIRNRFVLRLNISTIEHKSSLNSIGPKFYFPTKSILKEMIIGAIMIWNLKNICPNAQNFYLNFKRNLWLVKNLFKQWIPVRTTPRLNYCSLYLLFICTTNMTSYPVVQIKTYYLFIWTIFQ